MKKNVIKEKGKMLSLEVIMPLFVNWLETDITHILYTERSLIVRHIYIRKLVKIETESGVLRAENFSSRSCAPPHWPPFCLKM